MDHEFPVYLTEHGPCVADTFIIERCKILLFFCLNLLTKNLYGTGELLTTVLQNAIHKCLKQRVANCF
jgi:hypothetical protein